MPDDLMSASGAVTPPPATTAPDASPRERWRPIPGHKGYEASSGGRVRSVTRVLRDGRHAGGMVLAAQRDKDGYATLPPGPGLGVEIDEKALAQAAKKPQRYKWPDAKLKDGSIADY